MLLPPRFAAGVADGSITLAFRRWTEPRVKVGGTFLTSAGLLRVDAVDEVREVADDEVVAAGATSRAEVERQLRRDPDRRLYRVRLSYAGPDPRVALREDDDLSADDVTALTARLDRLDRAGHAGAWTRATLAAIAAEPGRRAPDLAAAFGRETAPFKLDVRKLKALGLTRSLPVGYELSPRGRAYLEAT